MRTLLGLALITSLVACGDDGGSSGGDGGTGSDGAAGDAPTDGTVDAPIDAMIDAPPGTTALTVKNYLAWCSISVDGGTASAAAQQVVNVAPGLITLTARRASAAFEVSGNIWHHTDGDNGAGEPGAITNPNDPPTKTSTAMVTVAATAKVSGRAVRSPAVTAVTFPVMS